MKDKPPQTATGFLAAMLIGAALAICLTSCVTADQLIAAATPPKFPAEQYQPLPKDYKAIASAAVKAQLFDPYSVHIEFSPGPIRSGFKNTSGQWEPAWQISMSVNAKNPLR